MHLPSAEAAEDVEQVLILVGGQHRQCLGSSRTCLAPLQEPTSSGAFNTGLRHDQPNAFRREQQLRALQDC